MIILDPVIHYPLLLWDSLLQFPYEIINHSKDGVFYAVGVIEKINDLIKYTLLTASKDIWLAL